MRVSDAIAHTLSDLDIEHVFGLMGDGNMHVISCIQSDIPSMRFLGSRHESAAVAMADGYSRTTGRVGVCTVTQGPGLTNTITALVTAAKANSPLVLLVGDTAPSQAGWPQDLDQEALLSSLGVDFINVDDPSTAHHAVVRAYRRAGEDLAPVVLNMPLQVQEREWTPWGDEETEIDASATRVRKQASSKEVTAAAEVLLSSERPVLIAGRGALRSDAEEAMTALADEVGALLGTTLPAKGLFAGHEACLGIVGSLSTNLGAKLVGEADCVVAVGAGLNDFTTLKRTMFRESATVVLIDLDPTPRSNRYSVDVTVQGDAREATKQLLELVRSDRPEETDGHRYRTPGVLSSIRDYDQADEFQPATDSEGIDPRVLTLTLDRLLPPERTIVTDVGHFFGFPATYMSVPAARRFVPAVEFGAVGVGLGTAIGAAAGEPDDLTVLFIGDGGLMMSLGDLETVARLKVPIVIVVMNDGAYGSELHMIRQWGLREDAAVFENPSFEQVSAALGVRAVTVKSVGDLEKVFGDLDKEDAPLLVDCAITTSVVAAWLEGAFQR